MNKKKHDHGHKMGKNCGYTIMEDGRILPAPTYADEFNKLSQERHGINDLMKLFSSHCADLLAEISRRQTSLWDRLCDDYSLNKETHVISYDGQYVIVKTKPKEQPPSSANDDPRI